MYERLVNLKLSPGEWAEDPVYKPIRLSDLQKLPPLSKEESDKRYADLRKALDNASELSKLTVA